MQINGNHLQLSKKAKKMIHHEKIEIVGKEMWFNPTLDVNVISVSGGKDSTALLLLALERKTENMIAVFADTGNENEITYDYVEYLNSNVFPITKIKADFTDKIIAKKEYVLNKWAAKGVDQIDIDRAAKALTPSGNPFLDLCLWKGRFPSTRAAFLITFTTLIKAGKFINNIFIKYMLMFFIIIHNTPI